MTGSPVGFNRSLIRPGNTEQSIGRCIGSACMAWRTDGSIEDKTSVEMDGLSGVRHVSHRFRVGHCGLSGPPGLNDREASATPPLPARTTGETT